MRGGLLFFLLLVLSTCVVAETLLRQSRLASRTSPFFARGPKAAAPAKKTTTTLAPTTTTTTLAPTTTTTTTLAPTTITTTTTTIATTTPSHVDNTIVYTFQALPFYYSTSSLWSYNTTTNATVQVSTPGAQLSHAFSPAGILYGIYYSNLMVYNYSAATWSLVSTVVPNIEGVGLAFHSSGDLYMIETYQFSVVKYNATDGTVARVSPTGMFGGNPCTMAIVGDYAYIFCNQNLVRWSIVNTTDYVVVGQYPEFLNYWVGTHLFPFCYGGEVHLGLAISNPTTNDIVFLNQTDASVYRLFYPPDSVTDAGAAGTGNGKLYGAASYCF